MTRRASIVLAVLLGATLGLADPARAQRDLMLPSRVPSTPLDTVTADGRPTPAGIAVLGAHARHRLVRLRAGGGQYVVREARFDSLGVTYEARLAEDGTPLATEPTQVPWTAIEAIETRRSNVVRGVLIGTFVLTIAGAMFADAAGPEPGPGILIVLAFPPAGALIGGLAGSAFPSWHHEWPPRTPRTP